MGHAPTALTRPGQQAPTAPTGQPAMRSLTAHSR